MNNHVNSLNGFVIGRWNLVIFHDCCGQLERVIREDRFQCIPFNSASDRRTNLDSLNECEMESIRKVYILKECLDYVTANKSSAAGNEDEICRHFR